MFMWFSLLPSTKMLNRNVQQLLRVLVAAHMKMLNFASLNAKDKTFSWSMQLKYPEELQIILPSLKAINFYYSQL